MAEVRVRRYSGVVDMRIEPKLLPDVWFRRCRYGFWYLVYYYFIYLSLFPTPARCTLWVCLRLFVRLGAPIPPIPFPSLSLSHLVLSHLIHCYASACSIVSCLCPSALLLAILPAYTST